MTVHREEIEQYIAAHSAELRQLTETLCRIPAPNRQERARVEFCKFWQEGRGARGIRIDEADNMVWELIGALYAIRPHWGPEGTVTTYNVGTVQGGTSVNTVAQEASMLYEYRSDEAAGLRGMEAAFQAVVEDFRTRGVQVEVEPLGTRPCGEGVDPAAQRALSDWSEALLRHHTGGEIIVEPASTDCNIPLSLGLPAVSFGLCDGGGAHTREEWIETASLETGLRIALETLLHFAEEKEKQTCPSTSPSPKRAFFDCAARICALEV